MIREKKKLTGNLNTKQSLNGSLSNSVVYVSPITQEKEVTPTREIQEVTPDIGYTSLSKVKVNGYTPYVASKNITSKSTYSKTPFTLCSKFNERGINPSNIVKEAPTNATTDFWIFSLAMKM